ncbi:MAG TPA: hypothetical protein VED01_11780 [Burkholderiales bacterium]|nr:hypothetical protein [Burkholderiales bacterium]
MRHDFGRFAVALASCLVVAACEHMPGDQYGGSTVAAYGVGSNELPLMRTDAQSYERGASVHVQLVNRTGRPLLYNLCRSSLERVGSDGGWHAVTPMLSEFCTAELRSLTPGYAVDYAFKLDRVKDHGEYRIRTQLHDPRMRTNVEAVSNRFQVRRDD